MTYRIGQEGVNVIYKALKCLLNDNYRELDISHQDKQTARAIIDHIDETRKSKGGDSMDTNDNRLGN